MLKSILKKANYVQSNTCILLFENVFSTNFYCLSKIVSLIIKQKEKNESFNALMCVV